MHSTNHHHHETKNEMAYPKILILSALALVGCVAAPMDTERELEQVEETISSSTQCLATARAGVHIGPHRLSGQTLNTARNSGATWLRMLHQSVPCMAECGQECNPARPETFAEGCGWRCEDTLGRYVTDIRTAHNNGKKVMLAVNGWAIPNCHPGMYPRPQHQGDEAERYVARYGSELRALVRRLRDENALPDAFQIGNEPNGIEAFDCGVFGRQLFVAQQVLEEEGVGDITRVTGGIVNYAPWTAGPACLEEAINEAGGTLDYDAIGVHLYGASNASVACIADHSTCESWDAAEDPNYRISNLSSIWGSNLGSYARLRSRLGASPPFWITETGGPLYNHRASGEQKSAFLDQFNEWSEEMQDFHRQYGADWHANSMRLLSQRDEVEVYFGFQLRDEHERLGLYTPSAQALPAGTSFRNAICTTEPPGPSACGTFPVGTTGRCQVESGTGPWVDCCDTAPPPTSTCGTFPVGTTGRCQVESGTGPWVDCCDTAPPPTSTCGTFPVGTTGRCQVEDGTGPWVDCCGSTGPSSSASTITIDIARSGGVFPVMSVRVGGAGGTLLRSSAGDHPRVEGTSRHQLQFDVPAGVSPSSIYVQVHNEGDLIVYGARRSGGTFRNASAGSVRGHWNGSSCVLSAVTGVSPAILACGERPNLTLSL